MGQAADCTPSKIIEFWEVLSFVVVRKCRTFAEAFAWGQGNVDNGNISHQKDWKEKKYRLLTPQNRLKSIKSLNLHPLECTLKGLWHISDLLRTKYWVITGCKYRYLHEPCEIWGSISHERSTMHRDRWCTGGLCTGRIVRICYSWGCDDDWRGCILWLHEPCEHHASRGCNGDWK